MPWYALLTRGNKILVEDSDLERTRGLIADENNESINFGNGQVVRRVYIVGIVQIQEPDGANLYRFEESNARIMEQMEDWKAEQERFILEEPKEKALREFNCTFKIRWFCRVFNYDIPETVKEKILATLEEFHTTNPGLAWAGKEPILSFLPRAIETDRPMANAMREKFEKIKHFDNN